MTFTESATRAIVVGEVPDEALGYAGRDIARDVLSMVERVPVVVLSSPDHAAGTGKTQIAAACARAAIAADRGLIAWVNAESAAEMQAELAVVAERLGIAASGESAAESLRNYLEHAAGPNLLVFDNLGDPAVLTPYLPTRGGARILVTGAAEFGETVVVGPFSRPESVDYLCRRAQIDDPEGADLLAESLGDLPLALTAAAAAIRSRRRYPERRLGFRECVDEMRGGGLDAAVALGADAALLDDAEGMLHRVLSSLAVLPPSGVTLPTLRRLAEAGESGPEFVDMAVDDCLRAGLVGYSLDHGTVLMHRSVAAVLRNRLTEAGELDHAVTAARALIEPEVAAGSPAGRAASAWLDRSRLALLEQAATESDNHDEGNAASNEAREQLAAAYLAAGQDDRAIDLWRELLAERTRLHGDLDPRTVAAVHTLATAHHNAGQHDSAVSVYESALHAAERGHGEDHPETLARRQDLARAMLSTGQTAAAITLLRRIIADRERVLGRDHPGAAAAREHLAAVHEYAGQHTEACTLLEPAAAPLYGKGTPDRYAILAARELAREYVAAERHGDALVLNERLLADVEQHADRTDLEPEDPGYADKYRRGLRAQIGVCLVYTKQYARAVPILREALSASRIAHGRHHHNTVNLQFWLARALLETDQAAEALVLMERSAQGHERIRGPVHPTTVAIRKWLMDTYHRRPDGMDDVVATMERLAADHERILGPLAIPTLNEQRQLVTVYLNDGRFDDATALLARVVDGYERTVGSSELQTHKARRLLARLYQRAERHDDAIVVLDLDLADLTRTRGRAAHETITTRDELAGAYRRAGRYPRAIELFEANVSAQEERLGPAHIDTLGTRETLAELYSGYRRDTEAAVHREKVYGHRERTLGADHPDTLTAAHLLGRSYSRTGREAAAIALWERTLARREQVLGTENPDTLHTREHLGVAYINQSRAESAVALLEVTLEARRRIQGPEHKETLTTAANLATAYSTAGRVDQAVSLHTHTLRVRESSLGPDHPSTLTSQNNLAMAMMSAGRHDRAVSLAERTLATRERVLGPDHPDTMISRHNLGVWYHTIGRYAQSVTLLQHTLDDRIRVLGPDHANTATTRRLLDNAKASAARRSR
ncbi:tetratricopeptide repeat protein [Nocardia sp. NEAU-G5]|uniref:Tetratricopeptide repeat protein n=1 Tax=Nocardia albiluteola TaxID=2842303 RepID=A0ABS6B4H9_9NOCA|nr:tetratricopeptide repeat protein [Nocardia albiluteola]MBU3065033.1 tetratricopeptide repeat protein [Nocardia albiluteola]